MKRDDLPVPLSRHMPCGKHPETGLPRSERRLDDCAGADRVQEKWSAWGLPARGELRAFRFGMGLLRQVPGRWRLRAPG
jgi:hypothetical protein